MTVMHGARGDRWKEATERQLRKLVVGGIPL